MWRDRPRPAPGTGRAARPGRPCTAPARPPRPGTGALPARCCGRSAHPWPSMLHGRAAVSSWTWAGPRGAPPPGRRRRRAGSAGSPAPDGWSPAGGAWSRPAAGGGSEPMRPPGITLPEASRSSQIAPTSQSARTILERRSSSLDAHRYRQRPGALLRPGRPALRAAAAHLAGRALTCQARKPEVVEGGDVAGLDGRVAFVTGSARGIGAATAKRLAADGAKLAVVDLEEAACKDTVEELGWLDVLVNNAGLIRDNLLFKMSDDDWGLVIDTHLRGSFNCARQAQRYMVERRWGKIVNLSSTSALGNRGQINYSTAKAGLQGMTKTLAIELGPFNVNVNAVAPGFIETDMTRATAARVGVDFENFKQAASTQIPLRRTGRPEDVAAVISFLCGEDSSYVSGQVIYVAGGPRA